MKDLRRNPAKFKSSRGLSGDLGEFISDKAQSSWLFSPIFLKAKGSSEVFRCSRSMAQGRAVPFGDRESDFLVAMLPKKGRFQVV